MARCPDPPIQELTLKALELQAILFAAETLTGKVEKIMEHHKSKEFTIFVDSLDALKAPTGMPGVGMWAHDVKVTCASVHW